MDVFLNEDQLMVQETAREWAMKNIAPITSEIDEKGAFPIELYKSLSDTDILGLMISKEYGGLGKPRFEAALSLAEIGAINASFSWSVAASLTASMVIQMFGTEEQKNKYLPQLTKGEMIASIALTEPASGTNWMMSLSTFGEKTESSYKINGKKCFISNAGIADIYLTFVKTKKEVGMNSFSLFIIEKDTEDFSFGRKEDKFGLRGDPTGELFFDNCNVPETQILGLEGGAIQILPVIGSLDCVFQSFVLYGIARSAMEHTMKYSKERIIGGLNKPLASFESIQGSIGDFVVDIEAMKLVACRGALAKPGPDPLPILSAKYCSKAALDIINRAMSMHGGYGCLKDFPLERYFRDAKTLSMHKAFDFIRVSMGKMMLGVAG